MYRVTEYFGDYQLSNQTFWNEKFNDVKAAEFVAEAVYRYGYEMRDRSALLSNIDDYYVLIETVDESGLGDLVTGWTREGRLVGERLEEFISKFE